MIDTPNPKPVETADDTPEDNLGDGGLGLYVEIETKYLYEMKPFDGFVIVRPATPPFYGLIQRMSYNRFAKEFEPYCGNVSELRAIQLGAIDAPIYLG